MQEGFMQYITDSRVLDAIDSFDYEGKFVGALPYGCGHINDTYAVYYQMETGETRRYLLQRINTNVFKKPDQVMTNITNVVNYLIKKIELTGGDPSRETLTVIHPKKGENFYINYEGNCWRSYVFIENAITYQIAPSPEEMYQAARVFGRFQRRLTDYPVATLYETIPDFHNTPKRFEAFQAAVKADIKNRVKNAEAEIQFIMDRESDTHILIDALSREEIPLRATHNDTKINNVMIDKNTGKGLCAIDLDTVMPGLSLYDFGDAIRSGANPAAEDEKDLSRVSMDLSFFESYTRGYLEEAESILTSKEIELLPAGAKVMTLECGMRFLTDYLSGDSYFKTQRPGHNLDRCRTQLKMVSDMEQKWDSMMEIVAQFL